MPSTEATIRRLSRKYGLDPRAVLAVAMGEGGLTPGWHVGDVSGGGSYGPFQLYAQGALPQKYRGNPKAANEWAWSQQGIDYALRKMAEVGAGGLRGEAAINTIIRKFERPADPDSSVRNALKRYGGIKAPKNAVLRGGWDSVGFDGDPISAKRAVFGNADKSRKSLLYGIAFGDDPEFLSLLDEVMYEPEPVPIPGPELESGVQFRGKKMTLPTSWKPTHVTDGLGWGTNSAVDIMGAPGTPVGAPESGVVVRWNPTGAQGGGSMWFKGQSGRLYWLGHIADGLEPGTRVRRGQVIAAISADHPRPHVHLDARNQK